MTSMTTAPGLPFGRPLTRADLAAHVEALGDDGHRWELLDGVLVVSPAPRPIHQRVALRLAILLTENCPTDDLEVFVAPFAVGLGPHTEVQPDVLIARVSDLTEKDLPTAPLLAVEVLSPSTRWVDLGPKRDLLARHGCPSYWVVDPVADRLIAWELRDGSYVEIADVSGDDEFEATTPYAVRLRPAELSRPGRTTRRP